MSISYSIGQHITFPEMQIRTLIHTCISSSAFTTVAVGKLDAVVRPSGVTRVRQAFIDVALTALPNVTRWAQTLVASDAIYTLSIVEAFGLIRK